MAISKLWVDTYGPKTLDQIIFASEADRENFRAYVREGSIPNVMLVGPRGTGKSSLSKVLVKELNLDSMDVLKINCSDEKIDAIRDKVKTFAYTMPIGPFKLVRLEEMDGLSHDAQKLLRDLVEEVSSSCRFVSTLNYENRILPELKDRFQVYHFAALNKDDVLIRLAEILETEKVAFELADLEKVAAAAHPSMRKAIILLEKGSKSGTLKIMGEGAVTDWKLQLLPLLETGDLRAARKLVCESATKEELVDIFRFLCDNIHRVKTLKGKEDQAVVLIAQYQYQHAFVADPEIQVAALFIELGAL